MVPGTLIRHYLTAFDDVRRVAEREKIPAAKLQPILDSIGAGDTPPEQMPERLRMFVEGARARASEPAPPSNDGPDIDAAIDAARDKLRGLDAAGARDLLQARIDEEERTRRQRLLPLLRERAAVERLAFDHEAAKATLSRITELDPDAVWDWISLGDLWVTTGSLAAALDAYGKGEAAARRIGEERDLSASHNKTGDVKVSQGDLPGALAAYSAAMAIIARLASHDPANSGWQRDLSVSHDRIGNVKVSQGDLPGALAAYSEAMAISERLAARDPANSEWQRDLSISHDSIGDVKVSQGDLPGALAAYSAAMAIRERLASRDPANSQWQRDLSVSHDGIGDVKVSQGDLPGALVAYSEAMAISERLVSRDPANSQWQRDVIVSCVKMASVAPDQARGLLMRALDVAQDLVRSGRLAPVDAWMPAELERRLAALPEG